jgi:hypothetical protein
MFDTVLGRGAEAAGILAVILSLFPINGRSVFMRLWALIQRPFKERAELAKRVDTLEVEYDGLRLTLLKIADVHQAEITELQEQNTQLRQRLSDNEKELLKWVDTVYNNVTELDAISTKLKQLEQLVEGRHQMLIEARDQVTDLRKVDAKIDGDAKLAERAISSLINGHEDRLKYLEDQVFPR